jgi:hypothetical protein
VTHDIRPAADLADGVAAIARSPGGTPISRDIYAANTSGAKFGSTPSSSRIRERTMPQAPKDPSKASHPTYRLAVSDDEAGILKVFAEVAPEVPTSILPQTEPLLERLVASGQSWVAVDADDNIIGYALAEAARQ